MIHFLLSLLLAAWMPFVQADDCAKKCATNCGSNKTSKSTWLPRSFGSYTSNESVMLEPLFGSGVGRSEWHGVLSVAPIYMQDFDRKGHSCALSALPFWSGTNTLTYGKNDGESNVDAYQLGLGNIDGTGSVKLNVDVKHFGSDMLLHFIHDKHARGMYFTLRAPLAQMRITTCMNDAGYTSLNTLDANTYNGTTTTAISPDPRYNQVWLSYPAQDSRYSSAAKFFAGGGLTDDAVVESSLHKPLHLANARIANCTQSITRLSEIGVSLGYQAYATEKHNVKLGFKFAAPTGNVALGKYALEPIVGRNGLWALGGELSGRCTLWQNEENSRRFVMRADGEVFHLRSGRKPQFRTFDLKKNGVGSRYMLAQFYFPGEAETTANRPEIANTTGRTPSFVTHVANLTTLPVHSKISVEGSLTLSFEFQDEKWLAGIGAEVWGRAKECLSIDSCRLPEYNAANLNDYAIVGRQVSDDARMIFDTSNGSTTALVNAFIPQLYLCEPEATINTSKDMVLGSYSTTGTSPAVTFDTYTFPGGLTTTSTGGTALPTSAVNAPTGIKDARIAENRIPAKHEDALDIGGAAAARATSVKVFGKLGRQFNEYRYSPQLTLFGGAEFAVDKSYETLNLWSVGLQGSLSF